MHRGTKVGGRILCLGMKPNLVHKSSLILSEAKTGSLVTDCRPGANYLVISLWCVVGVLLQEGRTCVGREDAINEQDIGKGCPGENSNVVKELLLLQREGEALFLFLLY